MWARAVLLTLAIARVAYAGPSEVSVFESRDRAATTEGEAILTTDPDTAYRVATDYASWSQIFPDVRAAVVNERTREAIDVTFVHRDGTTDHLRFRNRPAARTIAFQQLGGDADVSAEIVFTAGEVAGTTRVHSCLHADVRGLASAFVSRSDLRERRQRHLRDDLAQLQAYFEASIASRRP